MNVNAFVRKSVIDVVVHGDKVIIGQVEPVRGDVRIVANVPKSLLCSCTSRRSDSAASGCVG